MAWGLGYLPPAEAIPKVRSAASTAIELDDTQGYAHASLGAVQALHDWKWKAGDRSKRAAIESSPGDARTLSDYGLYCCDVGRVDEGLAACERAVEVAPALVGSGSTTDAIELRGRRLDVV